jgi:heme a synthase
VRAIRATAGLAAVLTYALIVLGALVRSTNSGLSCPDWPTCYGQWVLTPAEFAALPATGYTYFQVMLEWAHRLIAGVFLGPLILLLAALAFARRRTRPELARASGLLLLLLLAQGALGGVTVLDRNSPWSVALHLGNALLVLTTVLFVLVRAARDDGERRAPEPAVARLAGAAWALALLAMVSAAVTAKSGASLACSTWPLCEGAVVPDLADPLVRVHFAHRVLALLTGLALLGVAAAAWRTRLRAHAALALLLVAAQIGLGALVIILQVPVWKAVLHQAVGVLTFAVVTALLWRARGTPGGPRVAPTIGETAHGLALRGA